jgi:pantoate--beta-alanine ligase
MKIITKIRSLREAIRKIKLERKTIGFVPTMGALHNGHLSIIRKARKENDLVVVSIFVNPVQFGPKEDYLKYPRNLKKDAGLCKREGVDIIFYPDVKEMYPAGYKTYVVVEDLGNVLCGRFRPGHFRGVATVVTKLFNIVLPDIAYFGQKDAQQAIIIKRMVYDLNIPVKIKVMPIIRERDGLAMSSRNIYLNEKERKDALCLYQAINKARELINQGKTESQKIINKMGDIIKSKRNAKIDYISIVDLENLRPVKRIQNRVLVALAVWFGKTRLIDNIILKRYV